MPKNILKANNSWPSTKSSKEVLFFSLQIRECLDLKVWESYRVYSLSTLMRLSELQKVGKDIKSRSVPKKVIEPCLEEVKALVSADEVAKTILNINLKEYCETEFNNNKTIDELISSASLLRTLLFKKYQKQCEELIITYCFDNPNRIKLRNVTKLYAAFLINAGFSRKYIYDLTSHVFFNNDLRQIRRTKLTTFFSNFKIQKDKYRVFVDLNKSFAKINKNFIPGNLIPDRSKITGLNVDSVPDQIGNAKNSTIMELEVLAMDSHSAFLITHQILEVSQSLLFMYPHSTSTKFGKCAFVVKGKSKIGVMCQIEESAINNSRSIPNLALEKSFERLIQLLFSESGVDELSKRKIIRAATTASLADKSESLENQLVSIWAAFEALLPGLEMDDGVRVVKFCEQIVPCTSTNYTKDTLLQLDWSLKKSFGKKYLNFIENHESGLSGPQVLLEILIGNVENDKKALLKLVDTSPLAQNRLAYLERIFSNSKNYINFINEHENRVEWQIHRIYRERNSIVHTGITSPFLRGLVTNSISYFRKTCENFITYQEENSLNSISECIAGIKYSYQDKKKQLQSFNTKAPDNEENFKNMLRHEIRF